MATQIREYNFQDREACIEAFKSNVPKFFTDEEIADFERFLNKIEAMNVEETEQRKTHFYVVLSDNRVLGCGGFGDKDGANVISLAWGFVHKEYHKQGFGAQLLNYRLQEIKKLYPTLPVVLDTTQHSNPFFEKFGFITTKITKDAYAVGMHRYDMFLQ